MLAAEPQAVHERGARRRNEPKGAREEPLTAVLLVSCPADSGTE